MDEFDRVLRMGGGVIVGTIVARYLGPSNFGVLNYALAVYAIFNIASNLGLDALVVRDIILSPELEERILGSSFLLKVFASIFTTASAIVFTRIVRPNEAITIEIVTLLSFASISQGFDVVDFFLLAKTRSKFSILPKSIVFVVASIARLAAIFAKWSLLSFGWIAALEILFTELSLGFAFFRYHKRLPRWKFESALALSLLRESWPLMCSSILGLIYLRCDQILLGALSTSATVGLYSAAIKIAEIWYSIPLIICASVMPRLLKSRESDPTSYRRRLQCLYDLMAIVSILIGLFFTCFGRYFVVLMYGPKYLAASTILAVHIWTGIFVFVGVVSGYQMTYENLNMIKMRRSAFGALANVGLNFLLIPLLGGVGSSIATLIVQATVAYGVDCINVRTRHIFRMKTRALLLLSVFDKSLWRSQQLRV